MQITTETITSLLEQFTDHDSPILPDTELLDSGLLDSLAFIELLNALEDMGCPIQPTRIPRERFSTPESIAELCAEATQNSI